MDAKTSETINNIIDFSAQGEASKVVPLVTDILLQKVDDYVRDKKAEILSNF